MHEVISDLDRPERSIVESFSGLPSAIISDVTSKYENTMSSAIKPVWEVPEVAGTALTVKTYPGDNLMIHKAVTMAKPGDVLVIDANGYTEAGLMGELLARSCQAQEINGSVVDGAVRDVEDVSEIEFPMYARGVSPKGSYKGHPGSINVPVSCGGLEVHPGDIIVGDREGVAKVSPDHAEEVLEAAKAKLEAESELRERAENGEYIYQVAGHDEVYEELDIKER